MARRGRWCRSFLALLAIAATTIGSQRTSATSASFLDSETLSIDGSGREAFTTQALDSAWAYEAIVTGVVAVEEADGRGNYRQREVDALYLTDEHGNFTRERDSRVIGFRGAWAAELSRDRAAHRYVFKIEGSRGQRLSAYVDLEERLRNAADPSGSLRVEIRRLERCLPPTQIPPRPPAVIPARQPVEESAQGRVGLLVLFTMLVLSLCALILHAQNTERRSRAEAKGRNELEAAAQRVVVAARFSHS